MNVPILTQNKGIYKPFNTQKAEKTN